MAATLRALKRFQRTVQAHGVDRIRVVSTSAMRDARNSAAFQAWVKAETGWNMEIISGLEEGRLIHLGVTGAEPGAGRPRSAYRPRRRKLRAHALRAQAHQGDRQPASRRGTAHRAVSRHRSRAGRRSGAHEAVDRARAAPRPWQNSAGPRAAGHRHFRHRRRAFRCLLAGRPLRQKDRQDRRPIRRRARHCPQSLRHSRRHGARACGAQTSRQTGQNVAPGARGGSRHRAAAR